MSQRLEPAGPLGVELEEQDVDTARTERLLGHRLVAASRHPVTLVVATADVHGRRGASGAIGDSCGDRADVVGHQLLGVLTVGGDGGAHIGIAEHRQGHLVELDDASPSCGEIVDLAAVGGDEVGEERTR